MIKPIYGAASIGVVRVDTLKDLEKTYVRVQKEMSGARIVAGALQQADDDEHEVRFNQPSWTWRRQLASYFGWAAVVQPATACSLLSLVC